MAAIIRYVSPLLDIPFKSKYILKGNEHSFKIRIEEIEGNENFFSNGNGFEYIDFDFSYKNLRNETAIIILKKYFYERNLQFLGLDFNSLEVINPIIYVKRLHNPY